jgi:hypothetical protein
MENGYRENFLCTLLSHNVFVEKRACLNRRWERVELNAGAFADFFFDDFIAELDALIADIHTGAGDQFLDLFLGLAAERALQ